MTGVLAARASFAYEERGGVCFVGGGNAGGYGIVLDPNTDLGYFYVLGLLNCRLSDFYLRKVSTTFRGGYYSYGRRFIEQLPIRTIDWDDSADVARHGRMVALVQQTLDQHRHLAAATTPRDRDMTQRRIDLLDDQIDALVYELYGLTEEEIATIG